MKLIGNQNFLRSLQAIGAVCAFVGGIDLTGVASILPHAVAAKLVLALPATIAAKQILLIVGDLADDGIRNDSFKFRCSMIAFFAALVLALVSASCISTTAKDGSVVRRVDEEAVQPWREFARDLFLKKKSPPSDAKDATVPPTVPPAK